MVRDVRPHPSETGGMVTGSGSLTSTPLYGGSYAGYDPVSNFDTAGTSDSTTSGWCSGSADQSFAPYGPRLEGPVTGASWAAVYESQYGASWAYDCPLTRQ